MPPDRERVPVPSGRPRRGFLDEALQEADEELQRRGDFRVKVARDAADGRIVHHPDGRPVMTRDFVPWTDAEYETRRQQVRGFVHAVDKAGEVALQAESHQLGVMEDRISAEAESISAEVADLADEMSYGRISAANASARLEELRQRQDHVEDLRTEYLGAVERHEARREAGGYAHHMGILQRYPALHDGVVTALNIGQVPEVHNPYGHYDDLDPLRKVESPVYKARKKIEEELEPLRAKLHARDQLRGRTRSVTELQDRDRYPQLRTRP